MASATTTVTTKPIVAASGVGPLARISTIVIAGPSNASAAVTARTHDARLYVVATNPDRYPRHAATTTKASTAASTGLTAGSVTRPRCYRRGLRDAAHLAGGEKIAQV